MVLEELIEVGNAFEQVTDSIFMSDEIPEIEIGAYFEQLCQSINLPDEHSILVLALINRFSNKVNQDDELIINSLTIHRLVLTVVVIV